MWGMTPIDQMICRIQFQMASYEGIYTPPEAQRHSVEYPGYNGGSDWAGCRGSSSRRDRRQLQRYAELLAPGSARGGDRKGIYSFGSGGLSEITSARKRA